MYAPRLIRKLIPLDELMSIVVRGALNQGDQNNLRAA
jgi:hypothetical protein